ncbi:MAG TPA: NlpC/P60 family protein [Actinomycetota bacterium]|nr:NlpC/P60 family protein [Actinomycetota bacterium]
MRGTPRRLGARLTAGALVVLSASFGPVTLSSAAPSRQEVQQARARLDDLNRELSQLVEVLNQARIRLHEVQSRVAEVKADAERARAKAERAMASLNASAAAAYQGVGSRVSVLFEATSLADFSDRLEFIGSMAQADADLAAQASLAREQARWTADELRSTVEERRSILQELADERQQIEARVAEARDLFQTLDRKYREAVAARQAAREAAERQAEENASGGTVAPTPVQPPPAPSAGVQAVLDAAYSVIGTPYRWGGASPETGFDCSGFTMWSWAHAGVSLPHSSALQYASLPHVAREDLQPGDLVFFYSPISHVGIYVGGGRMIDSPYTGTVVQVRPIYWENFVGAARPG